MKSIHSTLVVALSLCGCFPPSGAPAGASDGADGPAPSEPAQTFARADGEPAMPGEELPPPTRPPVYTGDVIWARGIAVAGHGAGRSVALAPDGAISVAGTFLGELYLDNAVIASGSGYDGMVASLEAGGKTRAFTPLFGAGNHFAYATAWGANGAQVVVGGFTGSLETDIGPVAATGLWNGFVATAGPDGSVRSAQAFGGSQIFNVWAVATLANGDIVVAGGASGTTQMGATSMTAVAGTDAFVARITSAGEVLWARMLGTDEQDAFWDVAVTPAGASHHETIALVGSSGGVPVMVAVDGQGAVAWARPIGGGEELVSAAVTVLPSGDIAAALGMDAGQGQGTDVAIVRCDAATGDERWRVRGEGKGSDAARSIAATGADGVVVVGSFDSTFSVAGTSLTSAGAADGFALSLDAEGGLLWAHRFGGVGDDAANDVAIDKDGSAVVVGHYEGDVELGGGYLPSIVGRELLVLRLAP